MPTERQILEVIARCIAIMIAYHDDERTPESAARMVAEVQAVAGQASGSGLDWDDTEDRILRTVEVVLLTRYGPEAGTRLNAEFAGAFEGSATPWGRHQPLAAG